MLPLTLFLRREPSTNPQWSSAGLHDVCCYRDKAATDFVARFTWSYNRPRKGCKRVVLNCYRWNVVWLPDAKEVTV